MRMLSPAVQEASFAATLRTKGLTNVEKSQASAALFITHEARRQRPDVHLPHPRKCRNVTSCGSRSRGRDYCKVTQVILHGTVSPDSQAGGGMYTGCPGTAPLKRESTCTCTRTPHHLSGDTTPCKVTPVILHGVVSPDAYHQCQGP
jgi:hypothetical protein